MLAGRERLALAPDYRPCGLQSPRNPETQKLNWCPEPESNRHGRKAEGF